MAALTVDDSKRQAWDRFQALPWPSKTDEEWRRTDPASLPIFEKGQAAPAASARGGLTTGFCPAASAVSAGWEPLSPEWIRSGVILTDLQTALRQFPELVEEYLFRSGSPEGLSKFVALHQALWNQGIFCHVPDGVSVDLPLESWLEIPSGSASVYPHILLVVGRGASVTLVDERRPSGNGTAPVFSDEMVEIFLKEEARLSYIRLQRWDRSVTELFTQRAVLEKDAQFLNVLVGLGSRLSKANVETVLAGPGGRSELLGVLFGSDNQHFDIHTLQDHQAKAAFSDLLYKSALKDSAKAVYTGLIRIRKEAQKSDAYQANRNLLLSQGAKADSIPMLEIEADDVRCTHGVAVGPVDEEQAFYLMSRGLSEPEAQRLIVEGFFEQVFQRIPLESLREQLAAEVVARLGT